MSALSEALERQLRKIMPLPEAPPAAPSPSMSVIWDKPLSVKSVSLAFQEGSSDKVYHVQLVEEKLGYSVNFQYGRRGRTLIKGTKSACALPLSEARQIYDELVHSKCAKGYKVI